MYFRSLEKTAFMHLLVKMMFADGYALNSEKNITELVVMFLEMDSDEVMDAKDMADGQAERIIAGLGQAEKRFVSAALGVMIQIDNEGDYVETAYYSNLCVRCGLPYMGPRQAWSVFESVIDV